MEKTESTLQKTSSFYAPIDDTQRQVLLEAYLESMNRRDGAYDLQTGTLQLREAGLGEMNASPIRYVGKIPQADFDHLYADFAPSARELTPEMLVLLTYCKMNAGEAYGVGVVKSVRGKKYMKRTDVVSRIMMIAQEEEEYHTRILVGAANYFDIQVNGVYRPSLALKVLISFLAYSPSLLFHPILFASEAAGVYIFNWTLNRVGNFYKGQPELQEALAARLIEILVDEIGHVAFNRLVLSSGGLSLGRLLAGQTVRGLVGFTPELAALGFDRNAERDFARFDYKDLPQEVRSRGFFA
jgi:hypothetical protein